MTNHNATEISHSDDCEKYANQFIHDLPLRRAEIGQGTVIKRALPHQQKRMIGAWCFLDHAGPIEFKAGEGLDVGPHPHIGLQTFTWMIEGTMLHSDSVGTVDQLIQPKQVNLMTAGRGISHTEVAPAGETKMHAAQLWIALPDDKLDIEPSFAHYPNLPVVIQDEVQCTVLVGEFLATTSPVAVHTELLGVDLATSSATAAAFSLNPQFEYALILLDGQAKVNGHELHADNMLVLEPGIEKIQLEFNANSRVLLLGGMPFESPILLWWNFVARTQEQLAQARDQWINHDPRFGNIEHYQGERLKAPVLPERMKASK